VRVGGPDKGLWVFVGFSEESVDGGLEIDDALEDAALEVLPGELAKKPLTALARKPRSG
jgi:hypothetical protein